MNNNGDQYFNGYIDFYQSSLDILRLSNRGTKRTEFMREASRIIGKTCRCAGIEFWLSDGKLLYRWIAKFEPKISYQFRILEPGNNGIQPKKPLPQSPTIEALSSCVYAREGITDNRFDRHTLWIEDTFENIHLQNDDGDCVYEGRIGGNYRSLIFVSFDVGSRDKGLMLLKFRNTIPYNASRSEHYHTFSQTFGVAVAERRAQYALHERIKEMTCLYNLSELAQSSWVELDDMIQSIVDMLPPAWQYPEMASARIIFDDKIYKSANFRESKRRLIADIIVNETRRGSVEINYTHQNDEIDVDIFLDEERKLIDTVAYQVAHIFERRELDQQQRELNSKLYHADRLATIGQLAAGVAHELNEPLSSILGFAQLLEADNAVSPEGIDDLHKIEKATLHAREIVRKLLVFAREMPVKDQCSDINALIDEGIYLVESRCAKDNIELILHKGKRLPYVCIEAQQLHQILINISMNAIQAMPNGGRLTISTYSDGENVCLEIADTGFGMTQEVQRKIFIPFFTTKDVGEGTGLGLAVVYGIITANGGDIEVRSRLGVGSTFIVSLPQCEVNGIDKKSS
jgi:signal transduction histidine kinase